MPTEEFEEILHSIGKNLVLPLTRKGYKVLFLCDIMSDEYRLHEVEQAFRRSLPNDTVMEICLNRWLSGLNQISSVISCLDMLYHFFRMRKKTLVRTDIELLAQVTDSSVRLIPKPASSWRREQVNSVPAQQCKRKATAILHTLPKKC